MPIFDHTNDGRDQDLIEWTAGGESSVVIHIGGRRIATETVRKGEPVRITFHDETGEDDDD